MGQEDAKAALRRQVRAARRALAPAVRAAETRAVCTLLASLDALAAAPLFAAYAALPDELDIWDFVAESTSAGRAACLPRVAAPGRPLAFHRLEGGRAHLVKGHAGIAEPPACAPRVAPAAITAALVPATAVDRCGNRLGAGGGFYDITFSPMPEALLIAPVFACQLVDSVPHEPHDRRVDVIVAPDGILDLRG